MLWLRWCFFLRAGPVDGGVLCHLPAIGLLSQDDGTVTEPYGGAALPVHLLMGGNDKLILHDIEKYVKRKLRGTGCL